jgi:hypothetical protein
MKTVNQDKLNEMVANLTEDDFVPKADPKQVSKIVEDLLNQMAVELELV